MKIWIDDLGGGQWHLTNGQQSRYLPQNEDCIPVAETFGMKLRHNTQCPDRCGTDGTVACNACGRTVDQFLTQALAYLGRCVEWGKKVEDPGEFDPIDIVAMQNQVAYLERENHQLIERDRVMVEDVRTLHICARRYADGRMSYMPSLLNMITKRLLDRGIKLNDADGTLWARDGMGRRFDGLTEVEAAQGERMPYHWQHSILTEGYEEDA